MRSTRFAYHRPDSTREVVDILRTHGSDACVLAGGQSLLPLLRQRVLRPSIVVDVKRLHDLRYVRHDGGRLRIGALTRHVDIERLADRRTRTRYRVLPESARLLGHAPVRARGTIGGSIAHADPRSEWCVLAMLLDAEVVAVGSRGERSICARDFFAGEHRTRLAEGELVTELCFPAPAPSAAIAEFAVRDGDMALVVAAAAVTIDASGTITGARIALGGVAERPVRVPHTEGALIGMTPGSRVIDRARQAVIEEVDPPSDFRADGGYRRALAATVVARALTSSLERARMAHVTGAVVAKELEAV